MENLTENDYRELIEFMIEGLKDCGAYDIIQQIEELKKAHVIEHSDTSDFFPQMRISEEFGHEDYPWPVTYQDIYRAVIGILETYLITVPKMVKLTGERLGLGPSNHIVWATEAIRDSEEGFMPAMRSAGENREKIAELIEYLKLDS